MLSPEYLYQGAALQTPNWIPDMGVPLKAALNAANSGQPVELAYPYQHSEPACPIPPLPSLTLYGVKVGLAAPVDVTKIIDLLRQGKPVGICLKLTSSFYSPLDGVVLFELVSLPDVLHAVTIVGLGWDGNDAYFLIRNSWGSVWGQDGHAWISSEYVIKHSICAVEIL
jgi:C1A family cysteine protease